MTTIVSCQSLSSPQIDKPVLSPNIASREAKPQLRFLQLNDASAPWQTETLVEWSSGILDLRPTVLFEAQSDSQITLPDDLDATLLKHDDQDIEAGTCLHFKSVPDLDQQLTIESRKASSLRIHLPKKTDATNEDRLVLVLNMDNEAQLAAIGRTNGEAFFDCPLASQGNYRFFLSDGSKLEDLQTPGPDSDHRNAVKLTGEPTKLIRLVKPEGNDPYLLRIAKQHSAQLGTDSPRDFPKALENWLWTRKNSTRSPEVSVDRYFDQTFVMHSSSLTVSLPQGGYIFALTNPKTNENCLLFAAPELPSESEIQCPKSGPATVEASFLPEFESLLVPTFLENPPLASILESIKLRGLELSPLARSGETAVASLSRQMISKASGGIRAADQLILDNSFFDLGDFSRASDEVISKYLASSSVPDLAITSQNPMAAKDDPFNPLYMQTRAVFDNTTSPTADTMLTVLTNGALFYWSSQAPRSSTIPFPSDGRIAFSVYIPAYNMTDFVEIFVNGKLFKRRVLGRKETNAARSVRIEEEFNFSTDFQMSIYAWGKAYLPEFIYGQSKLMPRALLSRICFDVNKNLICDDMNFESDER